MKKRLKSCFLKIEPNRKKNVKLSRITAALHRNCRNSYSYSVLVLILLILSNSGGRHWLPVANIGLGPNCKGAEFRAPLSHVTYQL